MKKLMFALVAGVAATVATAASITQSDFETGYTAGTSKPTDVEASKFGYEQSNSSTDESVVKAYDANVTAYPGDRNAAFVGANDNYLELNTDGGTLYRSINDIQNEDVVGAARTVTSSLYIDTLVQFTVCDSAPDIDNDAKLAIWLQASDDETTTNLMVRAKTYAISGDSGSQSFDGEVTNFVIGAANAYQAGTWYRLTVEAVPNVFTSTKGAAGFKIRINGSYVKADRAAFTGSTALVENMVADYKGLINANDAEATIFLPINGSIIAASSFENNPLTLSAVGFSGTGAVDDILFTEDNPFFTAPTTLDFTLALNTNVISSVTYSINNAAGVTVNDTTVIEDVPVGATISLTSITTKPAEWQTFTETVAAGDNATVVDGTNVTLKAGAAFLPTDENLTTAGATVSAVANVPADNASVATFLETLGLNSELAAKFTTVAAYNKLLGWVAANSYTKSDVNAYEYSYERSQLWSEEDEAKFAIEMPVYVVTNANVAAFSATVDGNAVVGEAFVDENDASITGVKYMVEAGKDLVVTVSEFADAGAGKAYLLNGDTEDADWIVQAADHDGTLSVNGASNVVTLATSYEALEDWFALATVEVSTYVPEYYTAVELNKNVTSLVTNETETLTATFTPASAADDTYTWASSDDTVATVANGVVTAVGAGTATITVTATHDSTVTASCTVTVTAPVYYESISLNKATTSLVTNTTETLEATLTPASAADDSVTWTSSDDTVATVDQSGVVTAVGAGTATITAATKNYSATCTVTVTAPEPTPAVEPIDPYQGGEATYADAAAAAAAADAINDDKTTNIPLPASIKDGLSSEQKDAYYASVQAVADGTKVTVEFTSAGETAAQTSADTAATAVAAELGEVAASSEGGDANIATVPGFYYSILYKASLDASWTEQLPRVLGTGSAVPITVPKAGTAGFYQLKVSPVYKAE